MPAATSTTTMATSTTTSASPLPSRRQLLAGSDMIAGLIAVGLTAFSLPSTSANLAGHPDAALIRISAAHVVNVLAYNASTSALTPEDDPLWHAYERTGNLLYDVKPCTLVGTFAKAEAAIVEAAGSYNPEHEAQHTAERWAWDLLHDLIRLCRESRA